MSTSNYFEHQDPFLEWFVTFAQSSQSTLSEFHKVLLPVMAALSVVVFKSKPSRAMIFLGVFILAAFTLSVGLGVFVDMAENQTKIINQFDPQPDMHLIQAFFTRIQETLLMYFMMLVGIGVTNKSK